MACTTEIRAARIAGKRAPRRPIPTDAPSEIRTILGDNRNPNERSEKVLKFVVESVTDVSRPANPSPMLPPTSESIRDSWKKARTIALVENPSALRIPISRVRLETAENMVIIEPIIAAMLYIAVTNVPSISINRASCFA
jgi:hypothetical protein